MLTNRIECMFLNCTDEQDFSTGQNVMVGMDMLFIVLCIFCYKLGLNPL